MSKKRFEVRTLSQLCKEVCKLSGVGEYKDWAFRYGCKNGEARIYAKDVSYTNAKERGYYVVKSSGFVVKVENKRNPLPDLPKFPRDFYHDDIPRTEGLQDIHYRVEQYLAKQFPHGNWNGQDRDDAYDLFMNI